METEVYCHPRCLSVICAASQSTQASRIFSLRELSYVEEIRRMQDVIPMQEEPLAAKAQVLFRNCIAQCHNLV